MASLDVLMGFLISLAISSVIIYFAAKLLGEREGFRTAILAALIGSVIFALTSYFLGVGWIAALISGIAWLIALGNLYNVGWLKSFFIAIVIWIFTTVVSYVLPTSLT